MSKAQKRIYMLLVFAASLLSVFWTLSARNAFVLDDSTILSNASLASYDSLFSFYPSSVYLDRPMRDVLVKLLYDLFGNDYVLHHAALIATHLLNVLLAFMTARRIFALKEEIHSDCVFVGAAITAAIFGAWPNSLMAVQWVSGNNDLMGTTFALLAFLFYLKSTQEPEYKGQNVLLTLFFYYIAIRSKEMFFPLPLIFFTCEIYTAISEKKRFCPSIGSGLTFLVMLAFLAGIFYYKVKDQRLTVDPTAPYYQSFNPLDMLNVLAQQCMMYFDLSNGGFTYMPSTTGTIGLVAMLLGLAIACYLLFKGKPGFFCCYVAIGLSIVMVLPLVNQVHRLYLYFPAFFVGITVACAVMALPKCQGKVLALICLGCVLANNAPGPKYLRDDWYSYGDMESAAFHQLETIEKPEMYSNVYIRLEDIDAYTPFFYGPGSLVKLVYQDQTLNPSVHSMEEKIEYERPYVVLQYANGQVTEVARDEGYVLNILSVSPYSQPDGSLVLGIVPEKIKPSLQVLADGVELKTFIGSEFISATVPAEQMDKKTSVQIVLRDSRGVTSDVWEVVLQ